jgi:NADH dehydrogenase
MAGLHARITLIDRHNYHLFQPLSYQVATGALSPGEIAVPLRRILRSRENVCVLMEEVTGFDLERREVRTARAVAGTHASPEPYDALVVAGGSSYSYFGHEEWRSLALEVKSLDSALHVRGRILQAFEAAELARDPQERRDWLTFVVVGAGPTGVEMAGQIAELAYDTLPSELRSANPRGGRVLLVEAADRVLGGFRPSLSRRAARALAQLGVTVLLDHTVVDVGPALVELRDRAGQSTRVPTRTVVWAAGVTASPLARELAQASGAELDRAGRVTVEPDLSLPGHPEVFALGDMVRVRDAATGQARQLPGLAPVAMQQGTYVGRLLAARLRPLPATRAATRAAASATPDSRRANGAPSTAAPHAPHAEPFAYRDKGMLATIGRARAVADVFGLRLWGLPAWVTWLTVHIFYLIGFENRVLVLLRWSYSFFTRGRGTRLITEAAGSPPCEHEGPHAD